MPNPKVTVVGIDGGTWHLLRPLMKEGVMPNLARIVGNGASGGLRSTLPPWTPTAWSSFATGKNPGKHGVFGFATQKPDGSATWTSSRSVRAATLWRILNQHGLTAGLLNVPMTYPPEEIDGFMVSGFPSAAAATNLSYPGDLYESLRTRLGDYVIDVTATQGEKMSEAEAIAFLNKLEGMTQRRIEALLYLMDRRPTDFLMVVFMAADRIQHMFWKYLDSSQRLYHSPEGPRYREAAMKSYKLVDQAIGLLLDRCKEDEYLFLLSDHGFGPRNKLFVVNGWLQDQGFQRRDWAKSLRRAFFSGARVFTERVLSRPYRFPEAMKFDPCVDWKRTVAYAWSAAESGIYFCPDSSGAGEGARDEIRKRVVKGLAELRDNETGAPVIVEAVAREDAYSGPFLTQAPDLLLRPAVGYTPTSIVPRPFQGNLDEVSGSEGQHEEEGIVACYGQGIKVGANLVGASIVDLAPTILHAMGLPVPEDMDGRVLSDAFEDHLLVSNPVSYSRASDGQASSSGSEDVFSEDDEAEILERLKALGYVD